MPTSSSASSTTGGVRSPVEVTPAAEIAIGGRRIGAAHEPYVIAEVGVNHDGDPERALSLIDAAADAGAHAVKLQHFDADRLLSRAAKLAAYQAAAGETDPVAMLRRLQLPVEAQAAAVERAHARGVHAIVSVFSAELVPEMAALGWDAFKTASTDIVNRPLLDALAADGRPMVVSTGAASLGEVTRAAGWLGESGAGARLAMLQCVSCYPAPTLALGGIKAIADATGLPVGYSDHTGSWSTAGLAVLAGACILEKHLTDDRARPGPDHAASSTPADLKRYAWAASRAGQTLAAHGPSPVASPPFGKEVLDAERDVREQSRQSLVSTRDLERGAVLARSDLTVKRPGTGLPPFLLEEAIGRRMAADVEADTPLSPGAVAGLAMPAEV